MEPQILETEFGITFTNNETTGQTVEQVYQEWLDEHCDFIDGKYVLKQIDICPTKTTEQKLEETNQALTQLIINQL